MTEWSDGEVQPELERLRARVAELERDLLASEERERALHEHEARSQSVVRGIIDHSPSIIFVRDLEWRFILVNKELEVVFGLSRANMIGKHDYEVFPPEAIALYRVTDNLVLSQNEPVSSEQVAHKNGQPHTFIVVKFPIRDEHGELLAIGSMSTDITERKQGEEERAVLQARIIEVQRAALRELSTPLIPIADDVVVMPLIGMIDSQRAQQLMEALLNGVGQLRASTVIIDITGVQVVDTQVADALVRASKAVRLLGAEVVLTGIRPEVARTLVTMGADLGSIVIHGSLRSGIAYALGRDGAEPRRGAARVDRNDA